MLTWKGEQKAGPGTYWDIQTGERVVMEGQDILPGESSTRYIKAPSAVMLLFGPVLGLVYAIFLPFAGIAMTIGFVGKKIANAGERAVHRMADSTVKRAFFGWRPIQAYLARKRKR
jgi:hypothetical protein